MWIYLLSPLNGITQFIIPIIHINISISIKTWIIVYDKCASKTINSYILTPTYVIFNLYDHILHISLIFANILYMSSLLKNFKNFIFSSYIKVFKSYYTYSKKLEMLYAWLHMVYYILLPLILNIRPNWLFLENP